MNRAGFGHPIVWKKKMRCFHSESKSAQYGDRLAGKIFQKLVSNEQANLFPKIRDRIIKQFAFYRCIIVDTYDLNAGR